MPQTAEPPFSVSFESLLVTLALHHTFSARLENLFQHPSYYAASESRQEHSFHLFPTIESLFLPSCRVRSPYSCLGICKGTRFFISPSLGSFPVLPPLLRYWIPRLHPEF